MRPARGPGCSAADYPARVPRGAVLVADDTGCSVVAKHQAAVDKGAAALVVVSAGGRNGSPPGLFERDYYERLTLPVAVIGNEGGAALRRATGSVSRS